MGACTEGAVGTCTEGAGGAGEVDIGGACTKGAMGADEVGAVGACTEDAMGASEVGACTDRAGEGWRVPGVRGTKKPDGGSLNAGVPKLGTGWEGIGAGRVPAAPSVPIGGNKTNEESSLVRKSSSCVGGKGRRREKGNVVSSKTT